MHGKNINNLIVIENGQLSIYLLDDKLVWEVGRPSKDNWPDIKLHSATASRKHGRFQNMDGIWFYIDNNGKNGTVYNEKHIETGLNGRVKPIMLSDGDILIFGGSREAVINCKTIWVMFSTHYYDEYWRIVETRECTNFVFSDGHKETKLENPAKGTVIEKDNGLAIYMGDITYLAGDVSLAFHAQ